MRMKLARAHSANLVTSVVTYQLWTTCFVLESIIFHKREWGIPGALRPWHGTAYAHMYRLAVCARLPKVEWKVNVSTVEVVGNDTACPIKTFFNFWMTLIYSETPQIWT